METKKQQYLFSSHYLKLMLRFFLEESLLRKARFSGDKEAFTEAQEYPLVACSDLRDLEEKYMY